MWKCLSKFSFICGLFIISSCATMENSGYKFFEDVSQRQEVPCPTQTGNTLVWYTFGQSNSANALQKAYDNTDPRILNYFNGRCYVAKDPLLGPDGNRGSQWVVTAKKMIENGEYDYIIINAFGVGGTSIRQWTSGGNLVSRYDSKIQTIYRPTHFLWHQGESDAGNGMSREEYQDRLSSLVQKSLNAFPESKFYVSIATYCNNNSSEAIRDAQSSVTIIDNTRVFQGPNTDNISERYDNCHLGEIGQEKVSDQWVSIFSNH